MGAARPCGTIGLWGSDSAGSGIWIICLFPKWQESHCLGVPKQANSLKRSQARLTQMSVFQVFSRCWLLGCVPNESVHKLFQPWAGFSNNEGQSMQLGPRDGGWLRRFYLDRLSLPQGLSRQSLAQTKAVLCEVRGLWVGYLSCGPWGIHFWWRATVTVLKSSLVCVSVSNTDLCRRNSFHVFFFSSWSLSLPFLRKKCCHILDCTACVYK